MSEKTGGMPAGAVNTVYAEEELRPPRGPVWINVGHIPAQFTDIIKTVPGGLHPEMIAAWLASFNGPHIVCNHPLVVSRFTANRVIVWCKNGYSASLDQHPEWKKATGLSTGEFWARAGDEWVREALGLNKPPLGFVPSIADLYAPSDEKVYEAKPPKREEPPVSFVASNFTPGNQVRLRADNSPIMVVLGENRPHFIRCMFFDKQYHLMTEDFPPFALEHVNLRIHTLKADQ